MHIQEVHLLSSALDAQERFFRDRLGLVVTSSNGQLRVSCGESEIVFHQNPPSDFFYHYAFLIPTGSLEGAIHFLASSNIDLLPYKGNDIIHFNSGRSVYFYDADRNIAEFIERPLLDYPAKKAFSIDDLIKINEIGIPTTTPLRQAQLLCEDYGIVPLAAEHFNNEFCWVGDHEGVIISTIAGRNWLPTDWPCIPSPTMVRYVSEGKSFEYRFEWPF